MTNVFHSYGLFFAEIFYRKHCISACLSGVSVPALQSVASCNLIRSCTGVNCCIEVYLLEETFNVKLDIDPCEEVVVINIERLPIRMSLNEFETGKSILL